MYNSNSTSYSVSTLNESAEQCPWNSSRCEIQTSNRKNSMNDFELITPESLSSSISIVDDFTPLASPLYSTAIAYSPTTDII